MKTSQFTNLIQIATGIHQEHDTRTANRIPNTRTGEGIQHAHHDTAAERAREQHEGNNHNKLLSHARD